MRRLILLSLCLLVLVSGCDSDSESHSNLQNFPQSPIESTTTREVPAYYSTIQAAIDAAETGDTVWVAAGTYTENLTTYRKRFNLRGAGKGRTTISGTIRISEGADVSIEALTIRNGGIYATQALAVIASVEVLDSPGVGVWMEECRNMTLTDNDVARSQREGVRVDASAGTIGSSRMTNNATDGIVITNASILLTGNHVSDNGRDGVSIRGYTYAASPHLLENTIRNNGGSGNSDIICFGDNTNPTGAGNVFGRCTNCAECRQFAYPTTYTQ